MPELPEVETVCRGLDSTITGHEFITVQKFRDNLRFPFPEGFTGNLQGRKITSITRRAKYILIHLDNSTTLIAHLGMSGRIVVHNSFRNKADKHDHVIFRMDDGKEVVFNDPRRFGMMDIVNSAGVNEYKLIKNLGPEPLAAEFTGNLLHRLLSKRKIAVKLAIMNANLLVGVGNIYACEALFRSGINPERPANSLSLKECENLANDIKTVLLEAIEAGGSSWRDYTMPSGEAGYFQHKFRVYDRENQPCITCGNSIKRIIQGGRSTFYCATCQN